MPDIIQLLPDHVANQIAAGEVVRFEQFVDSTAIFSGASFAKFAGYSASLDSQKINTASAGILPEPLFP